MHDQPRLFDMPRREAPAGSGRGRTRETYARTVVADVTVCDEAALRAAALRALDGGVVVIDDSSGEEDDLLDLREDLATRIAAVLESCIEPTTGLWPGSLMSTPRPPE
ncbi:MAG: hypothetical protein ACRDRW_11930, partial [Pseudonocardiaceae bacterium]